MNILVDHGAYLNLGDIAMLESAVARLHHVLPEARLAVIYRELPTKIYQLPFVTPIPNYEIEPTGKRIIQPVLPAKADAAARRLTLFQLALGKRIDTLTVMQNTSAATLNEFSEPFDALHLVGGGVLNDVFPLELLKKSALLLTFAAQNKPTVLTGQQLGPFQNPFFKRVLARGLRGAEFVGVREPTTSMALCQEFGLDPTRYALMGEDAFGLAGAGEEQTQKVLSACGVESKKFIAMNLRVQYNYAPEFERHVHRMAELAETLAARMEMPLLFVPIATDPESGDSRTAQRVAAEIHRTPVQVLDRPDLSASLVKAVLAHARGAVGVSYHFCNFALSAGVPTVNVYDGRYYTQKAQGQAAFWGDARLALALQNGRVEDAARHILDVFNDEALSQHLNTRAREAVANWETIFDAQARKHFGEKP